MHKISVAQQQCHAAKGLVFSVFAVSTTPAPAFYCLLDVRAGVCESHYALSLYCCEFSIRLGHYGVAAAVVGREQEETVLLFSCIFIFS
jgi:hypothetical protein